eukprot:2383001-Rhodomonas_salina.1
MSRPALPRSRPARAQPTRHDHVTHSLGHVTLMQRSRHAGSERNRAVWRPLLEKTPRSGRCAVPAPSRPQVTSPGHVP